MNDGIADGTTALMVAAMLGNEWAITRWERCTTPPTTLGQEKEKHLSLQTAWLYIVYMLEHTFKLASVELESLFQQQR